jgi:hypothetical protein
MEIIIDNVFVILLPFLKPIDTFVLTGASKKLHEYRRKWMCYTLRVSCDRVLKLKGRSLKELFLGMVDMYLQVPP